MKSSPSPDLETRSIAPGVASRKRHSIPFNSRQTVAATLVSASFALTALSGCGNQKDASAEMMQSYEKKLDAKERELGMLRQSEKSAQEEVAKLQGQIDELRRQQQDAKPKSEETEKLAEAIAARLKPLLQPAETTKTAEGGSAPGASGGAGGTETGGSVAKQPQKPVPRSGPTILIDKPKDKPERIKIPISLP